MSDYKWIVTTNCVTRESQDVQRYQQELQRIQGMGLDIDQNVEKPRKVSKFYQFHIKEVESVVGYDDEDFGEITVVNKYNGMQVPIIEDPLDIARVHKEYNQHRDRLLEDSFKEVRDEI